MWGHLDLGGFFYLSINKDMTVAEMYSFGWGEGGEAWGWCQRLLAWEKDLVGECTTLLSNVALQDIVIDVWQWRPNVECGEWLFNMWCVLNAHETGDA